MNTLNIGCWNINQRAGSSSNTMIPDLVFEELLKRNLDIIILTEFYESLNYKELVSNFKKAKYTVKTSEFQKNANQIFIAVKNELITSDIYVHNFNNINTLPNLLHLNINNMNIIGTRIKVGGYSKNQCEVNQEFKDRRTQLRKIIDYSSKLEGRTIILGDFNNGKHNNLDKDKRYKGLAREYFNYYLMKEDFKTHNFLLHTPENSYSWQANNSTQCKLDHIIVKNISKVTNVKYDWSFLNRSDYKEQVGYPDHAILTATIES